MSIQITKKDIIWNYLGSIFNIGIWIFLLPIMLRMLSSKELGLWYVFASISALVTLVDFGFSPSITRNITYCWCGAKNLRKEGIPEYFVGGEPNYPLLKSLIEASRRIYLILSLVAGMLLLTGGSYYIYTILPEKEMTYFIAWLIYVISIFINVYYSYWTSLLRGIGAIKQANQAIIYSRVVLVVVSIVGLICGGGLILLSTAFLLSGLLMQILSKIAFIKIVGSENLKVNYKSDYSSKNIFHTIWPNSKKLGIATIATWMITRASTLLCSSFLGLEITAKYGLTLQLLGVIGVISSLLFNSYIPVITSAKISGDVSKYMSLFSRSIAWQWITGVMGIGVLVAVGPLALKILGSNSSLLSTKMIVVLSVILFLEWNHSTFGILISLSNTIPFLNAGIFSGIAIVISSIILLKFTTLGMWGLILSQGVVQLLYNNWYWPRLICRKNNITFSRLMIDGIVELGRFVYNGFGYNKKV